MPAVGFVEEQYLFRFAALISMHRSVLRITCPTEPNQFPFFISLVGNFPGGLCETTAPESVAIQQGYQAHQWNVGTTFVRRTGLSIHNFG